METDRVDAYVGSLSEPVRSLVSELRTVIRASLPDGEETISYGIPTVKHRGRSIIHFAGFKGHVGVYPVPLHDPALEAELAPYASGKATMRLTPGKPVPDALIARVIAARLATMSS